MFIHPLLLLRRLSRRANPTPEFKARLRVALENRGYVEQGFWRTSLLRLRMALIGILSFCTIFGGTVAYAYASENVLPGHVLYPVRILVEEAETRMTFSPKAKEQVRVKHEGRRMHEQEKQKKQEEAFKQKEEKEKKTETKEKQKREKK